MLVMDKGGTVLSDSAVAHLAQSILAAVLQCRKLPVLALSRSWACWVIQWRVIESGSNALHPDFTRHQVGFILPLSEPR